MRDKKIAVKCVYCGSKDATTIDHVVPVSWWKTLGVPKRQLNTNSNRVRACSDCNAKKGAIHPKVWFEKNPQFKRNFEKHAKYVSDKIKKIAGL